MKTLHILAALIAITANVLSALVSDKLNLAADDKFHWKAPAYELMGKQATKYITENPTTMKP